MSTFRVNGKAHNFDGDPKTPHEALDERLGLRPDLHAFDRSMRKLGLAERRVASLQHEIKAYRDISTSMAFENP